MKKSKKIVTAFLMSSIVLTACGRHDSQRTREQPDEISSISEIEVSEQPTQPTQPTQQIQPQIQPTIEEADYSAYFEGLTGGAVFYYPDENRYSIYNEEICNIRRSPCSTFKIISSLSGIENGIISEENSVRTWSGEEFWNDKWNRDIDFKQAFQSSCIWYFREVINELGPDLMQKELDRLEYGNCDISDWEGYLNNNNNNRSLTGFWVESSLKISPKEQVEVLNRIFGKDSVYHEDTLELLKDAMLVADSDIPDHKVYGKTGLGMSNGIVVDAWFTGFMEMDTKKVYFCVYLGETDNMEVSSSIAKKISLQLLKN